MLDFVFRNHTSQKAPSGKFFANILSTGIKELKIKDKKIEVGLNLVGEAKIKELNKKYRGKNKVTDVLSFPLDESRLRKHGILPLGDIFICLPFVIKELKKSRLIGDPLMRRELAWLTVHGFLHLLGYDHEKTDNEKEKMFGLENKILKKLNF